MPSEITSLDSLPAFVTQEIFTYCMTPTLSEVSHRLRDAFLVVEKFAADNLIKTIDRSVWNPMELPGPKDTLTDEKARDMVKTMMGKAMRIWRTLSAEDKKGGPDFSTQNLYKDADLFNRLVSHDEQRLVDLLQSHITEETQNCSLWDKMLFLSTLTQLWLTSNQLQSLPDSFGNLANLTDLWLSCSQLQSLPDSFGNLANLTVLGLSNNQLQSLPNSFVNLGKLTKLWLNNNQLQSLPDSFGNLGKLTELWLSHSQLKSLPDSFGNLANLTDLALSNNQLKSLPDSFGNLGNLTILLLSYNNLQSLPDSFGNLEKLTSLWLSHNQLKSLPTSIKECRNLRTLDVSSNQLTCLAPELINLPLKSLNIVGNPALKDNFETVKLVYELQKKGCEVSCDLSMKQKLLDFGNLLPFNDSKKK
jgi:Leucine-rich repeat (LRR) protein